MTYDEITTLVQSFGLPFEYYQFTEDTAEPPPFVCYYYPGQSGFAADNKIYLKLVDLRIELYTRDKRWDLEATIEEKLNQAELPFDKTESWIDSEKMLMITYDTEVFINGN